MSTPEHAPVATTSDPPDDFSVVVEPLGSSGAVLTVSGELDIATAPTLRERLYASIDAGANRLVVDLSPVTFMDSVALATILHARRRLGDESPLAVVIPRDSYTRLVFEIAGLPQCLSLFETREDAIAGIGS
jgi:anti-sigma B factor antagonist